MYFLPRYFSMVLALAGDSTTTSVLFVFVLVLVFAFVAVLAFVAAKPSLPLSTPVGVQFIFYDQSLELHLQEREGQTRHLPIREAHEDLIRAQRVVK